MDCTLYHELREDMNNCILHKFPFFKDYSKDTKFIWLMSNLDNYVLSNLIKYVQLAFKKRRETEGE